MTSKQKDQNWSCFVNDKDEFLQQGNIISDLIQDKSILLLKGDLGSGKTTLVRAICHKRGFTEAQVTSPTFALHHEYRNLNQIIHHLDLYRLENEDELETSGFWDLFSTNEGLIIVEWPERIQITHLPFDWSIYEVRIEKISDAQRKIQFQKIR